MSSRLRPWTVPPGLILVTLPWVALTLLHYFTPAHHVTADGRHVHLHLFHDVYRRLYHFPILSAAVLEGLPGGLLAATAVSVAYLPHVVMQWAAIPTQRFDALFEIALYFGTGALVGSLAGTLRRQREALWRTDRLRGAGELAAGMAHEVRNPLAAMTASAERLRAGAAGAEREELLRIIEKEGARLDGVVRDFLTYARPAPLAVAPADLNAVAAETAALVRPTASKRGVTVAVEPDPALASVLADAARVKQALLNLVLNAVQASPDGAEVTVALRHAGGRAEIRVRDHGPGLPPSAPRERFAPFATTKEGGTGLGLPVAVQILDQHGGGLRLEDAPGGGTVAVAVLPARRG